ncbi:response regulator transcription factor [Flavobacteriaceae bacterium M23B6Z8]
MKQTILIFSALIAALLVLFQISKYSILMGQTKIELVIALVAVIFFLVGIFLHKKSLLKPHKNISQIRMENLDATGLSEREYEVLKLVAIGLSNKEIAAKLFVTESTVKTHVSNILLKLDAKRRTEAIKKAKSLQIIDF